MRPAPGRFPAAGGGGISSRARQALIALPLLLAGFALALQFTGRRSYEHSALYLAGGLPASEAERTDFLSLPGAGRAAGVQPDYTGTAGSGAGVVAGSAADRKSQWQQWRPEAGWEPGGFNIDGAKLAFIATTSEPYNQIRVWIQYHQAIGVSLFYLFVDGQAARPEVADKLEKIEGVKVVKRDEGLKKRQAASRIWNETWLSAFFHKPCNHELFVLQSLNMEVGIQMAQADKADWILHVDTDELMYPGGAPEYSLQRVLEAYPEDVDTVVFPNYESLPERDDVADPFTEVSLFKRNYAHVVSDAYFKHYHSVSRGNPNYFITYGNGKSAARVRPGLRPNGAHRWYSYTKAPREETSEQGAVLHYTYNRFSDLKSRRDRCDCAPTEEDAKRCFILPFDRMAFLAASLKPEDELLKWFRERLVWSETDTVLELLKNGLLVRMYTPQVLIRGFMAQDGIIAPQRSRVAQDAASQAQLEEGKRAQQAQQAQQQQQQQGAAQQQQGAG